MTQKPKIYTLEEAEALLPRIRVLLPQMRVVRDEIVRCQDKSDIEEMTSHGTTGSAAQQAHETMLRLKKTIAEREGKLEAQVRELEILGCELKGLDPGLVDFYSERKGELVYLCWREDEPHILFWHSLTGGFASRQSL